MNKKTLIAFLVIVIVAGGAGWVLRGGNSSNGSVSTATSSQPKSATSGKSADYSGKGLSNFPKQALSDDSIINLNLSNNNLTGALPSEIQKLQKLQTLDVSNNRMTGIPAEVGQLTKLKTLNYANNQITGLPNELGNLTQLEVLNLSGNPHVSQQDLAGIRAKLTNTQIIL